MLLSRSLVLSLALSCTLLLQIAQAQDPAGGWMAYAVGQIPDGKDRITRLEMTWKVGESAATSRAFYSPWFGMDTTDNLNLIQPVNPWSHSSWSMYTEYYQWQPTHNSNSKSYSVKSGQTLHGMLVYDASSDAYELSQEIMETGEISKQTVPCQNGKKYTIPYVVFEKTFPCRDYPPDENVTFYNIKAECDGEDCTKDIQWKTDVKDANCNMQAHILSQSSISITWDTSVASKYDNWTDTELFELNMNSGGVNGWAKRLSLERPRR